MEEYLHVISFERLQDLETALGKFSAEVSERIRSARRTVGANIDSFEEHCRHLDRNLRYWQDLYESADEDDDLGYLAYRCDQAAERLVRARSVKTGIEELGQQFFRRSGSVNVIAEERLISARSFLRQKIDELNTYVNVAGLEALDGGAPSTGPFTAAEVSNIQAALKQSEIDEIEAKKVFEENPAERTGFGLLFGQFAHERVQEKFRECERRIGRKERKSGETEGDFGIEFQINYPVKNSPRYDYVDFALDVIIDYKSARRGETEEEIAKKKRNSDQRRTHIRAYKKKFGVEPVYRYMTYQSVVNMFDEPEQFKGLIENIKNDVRLK